MIRKTLGKVVPPHTILPLLLTALSMLCSYQAAKMYQIIFGFSDAQNLSLPIDGKLPFLPGWGWIYIGAFPFWIYIYTTVARDSKELACKMAVADVVGKLICLLFFLFLPTTNTRPQVHGSGLSPLLMRIIYALDTPTNLFPSIHCFVPWLGTRCMLSAKNLKKKWLHCTCSFVGTLLVFASTQFTKQHVLVDVFGGIAVAEFGLLIARITPLPQLLSKGNDAFTETKLGKFLIRISFPATK